MRGKTSFFAEVAKFEAKHRQTKPSAKQPPTVRLSDIRTAPEIFQPRQMFGSVVDEYHVKELKRSLSAKGATLAPILVFQIGRKAYCIDGHHRLEAYKQSGTVSEVPVEWFNGTVREATGEAVRRNSRDKLPMDRSSKLEAAWRMVVLDQGSKSEISAATTVAESTVGNMRLKLREIVAAERAKPAEPDDLGNIDSDGADDYFCTMSWREAKAYGRDAEDKSDEWEQQIVLRWEKELRKAFGKQWSKQPRLAAQAIAAYSERLPKRIAEHWMADGLIDGTEFEE